MTKVASDMKRFCLAVVGVHLIMCFKQLLLDAISFFMKKTYYLFELSFLLLGFKGLGRVVSHPLLMSVSKAVQPIAVVGLQ